MTSQSRAPGRWALKALVFALCCVADVFVLRIVWERSDIAEGQFRRGYFERFDDEVGLAMDNAVRPDTLPRFLLTQDGGLGIPPGMTAIVSLVAGQSYEVASDSNRSPYIVIGTEAPVSPASSDVELQPGEARVVGARTLALQDGRLAFVAWDPTRPWRDDEARLAALLRSCEGEAGLTVRATAERLDVRLGRCSLAEPLPSPAAGSVLLAVPAGPEWATVVRRPGWTVERSILWPAFAVIAVKEMATWFGFGLTSAAAISAALAGAALLAPFEAVLTWGLTLIIAVVATVVRTMTMLLRSLPRWGRVPVVLAIVALIAWAIVPGLLQPRRYQSITRTHQYNEQPDACAVVGYSTVKGEALRRERGGIRWLLGETCPRCRGKTAALFASGETLAWLRNAYCASTPSFGEGGQVTFLGGANDDFLSAVSSPRGALPMARAFLQPGLEPWQHGYEAAAAASLTRIDDQVSSLEGLMQCVHSRRAQFLFLHDFMASDMIAGRPPDRAAMLARRRAAVESAHGTFVDLLERFGTEAGVSWFNDAVHLSLIGHLRVAELACDQQP